MCKKDEKRKYLDRWAVDRDKSKVARIAKDYPNCGCEGAQKSSDGHGPVSDHENLRIFVTSTSNINLKKSLTKKVTASIFRRIFTVGLSTIRIDFADKDEIFATAKELFDFQFGRDKEYGGIVGALEFSAMEVRYCRDNMRLCCVLETPLGNKISHADIISSEVLDEPQQSKLAQLLFNNIGGVSALIEIGDVDSGYLSVFTPSALMNQKQH